MKQEQYHAFGSHVFRELGVTLATYEWLESEAERVDWNSRSLAGEILDFLSVADPELRRRVVDGANNLHSMHMRQAADRMGAALQEAASRQRRETSSQPADNPGIVLSEPEATDPTTRVLLDMARAEVKR